MGGGRGARYAQPRRILTVCLGNICRSPVAAAVLARHGGPAVEVRSAGLSGKWTGQPADPAMVAAAAARGYDLTGHRAAQVDPELMRWAQAILAMDRATLAALRLLAAPEGGFQLGLYLAEQDVPDPFGRRREDFAACVVLIESGAARHLQ